MLIRAPIQSALPHLVLGIWSLELSFGQVMKPSFVRTISKGGRQTSASNSPKRRPQLTLNDAALLQIARRARQGSIRPHGAGLCCLFHGSGGCGLVRYASCVSLPRHAWLLRCHTMSRRDAVLPDGGDGTFSTRVQPLTDRHNFHHTFDFVHFATTCHWFRPPKGAPDAPHDQSLWRPRPRRAQPRQPAQDDGTDGQRTASAAPAGGGRHRNPLSPAEPRCPPPNPKPNF